MTERYSAKEVCVGNCVVVQRILSHPKYTGCVVFNQKSGKLRSRTKRNPRREWIIISGCFEPLIGKEQFDRAQERLRKRAFLKSDEELLTELSVYVEKHGKATQEMLRNRWSDGNGLRICATFREPQQSLGPGTPGSGRRLFCNRFAGTHQTGTA
jgi:hypothetical protein